MSKLDQLIAEMMAAQGQRGFGAGLTTEPEEKEENPILKLLRGQSLEPYALDPSMGDQRLRVPRAYGPGGGGVFFTGGSPFKVDKKDQRTLAQGAMAKTIMDVLSGRVANATAGAKKKKEREVVIPADSFNGGDYGGNEFGGPSESSSIDPKVLKQMLEEDLNPEFIGPLRRR